MSALMSWPAVRRWPLLFALLVPTAPVFADSITIGSLTYVGTGVPESPRKAKFELYLNTEGLTFYRDFPHWPVPLILDVQVFGWDAGVFQTIPATGALLDPPHYCPCEGVVFNMSLLETYPFRLANGKLFIPSPTLTVSFYPLPGQTYLQTGQSRRHRAELAAITGSRARVPVAFRERLAGDRWSRVEKAPGIPSGYVRFDEKMKSTGRMW